MRQLLIAALVAALVAACGTPSQVTIDTGGLKYESGGVGIALRAPEIFAFIHSKWLIDNWRLSAFDSTTLFRKTGSPFEGTLRIDMNNDGRVEDYSAFFTDLELRNAETSGQIWVLMRELPKHRAGLKLDVLVDAYAENLSFEGYTRTGPYDVWFHESKAYAARVVSKEAARLGAFEAVIATIEIANLAQLQLDPNSRMGFVRVLIVRVSGFKTNMMNYPEHYGIPHSNVGLLVVGYYESTAYFEKGLADFEAFLGQFTVNGKSVAVERAAPAADTAPQTPASSVAPGSTASIESTASTEPTAPTEAP